MKIKTVKFRIILVTLLGFVSTHVWSADNYLIGTGIYDITGPAAEVGMMGYAEPAQRTNGVHDRQWARAFIIAEANGKRVIFVNVDQGAVFQSITQGVVSKLQMRYGDLYDEDNLIISATHTHSGAGGHSHYALYNITTYGYIKQNYDVVVNGIFQAIINAHNDLKPGSVYLNKGTLAGANKNRSLPAFKKNPESQAITAEDHEMLVLKFKQGNHEVGMISWFATHAVSMPGSNTLLSSDNKGYAQYLFEKELKGSDYQGNDDFIAAFAQTNSGDMTPNINLDGTGPGGSDYLLSTQIIGKMQFDKALELYNSATEQLTGPIDFRHRHLDFSNQQVDAKYTDGQTRSTCVAALGVSFAAGTEDGRGVDFFQEGALSSNPFWQFLTALLTNPSESQKDCHAPKPILLAQGNFEPYPWSPEVLPVSIVTIGQLGLLAVPAEFTRTAGYRLKNTVKNVAGIGLNHLVIAGYSNAYSGYVTTSEEYAAQHYEGGSTHFGPWTLAAYQQSFERLAQSLVNGYEPDFPEAEPYLRNLKNQQMTFQTGVVHDQAPIFKRIGDVSSQPASYYHKGAMVKAIFWAGHPKNDLRTQSSFLKIQRYSGGSWQTIANDNDWSTQFEWKRIDGFWGTSHAIIKWTTSSDTPSGKYRIIHQGSQKKPFTGVISPYTGTSRSFWIY